MFTVRMDEEQIQHLKDVAKAYGSESAAHFAREMFTAMLSPDVLDRMNFVHALAVKLGGQLALPLPAPRVTRKPRKKRRPRDRAT